jgi:hypothetical protein
MGRRNWGHNGGHNLWRGLWRNLSVTSRWGCGCLVTLIVGLVMLFGIIAFSDSEYGKVHQLTCERLEANYVTCQNQRRGFLGLSQEVQTFRLRSLQVDSRETGGEDSSTVYFLTLATTGFTNGSSGQTSSQSASITPVDIDQGESNRDRVQVQFDQLNRLLNGEAPNPKVTLNYGDGLGRTLLLLILWLAGVSLVTIVWWGMAKLLRLG